MRRARACAVGIGYQVTLVVFASILPRWPSVNSAIQRLFCESAIARWTQEVLGPDALRPYLAVPTCSGSPNARYRAPSDVLILSRTVFSMRDRMEAISATAGIHHTSCRRCPNWTVDGYRSDTQGLPPRYADRGSADESRERGCRRAHRRAEAARLHARSKPDIRSPWCGGQIEPNAATNGGTEESRCRCRGDSQLSGSGHRQIIGHSHGHSDRLG